MTASRQALNLALIAVLAFMTSTAVAGDGAFSGSLDVLVADSYIWRGVEVDDEYSLQPSLTLAYQMSQSTSVAFNGWWNIALDDHGSDQWEDLVFEQDFTLSLSHAISDRLSLDAGYIYYSNPRSDVDPGTEAWQTDELYLGLSWLSGPMTYSATLYRDFDLVKGWYLDLSASGSRPVGRRCSLDYGAQVWVTDGVKPDPESPGEGSWYLDDGLVSGSVWTGLGWTAGRLRFAATLTYSTRFDDFTDATGLDEDYLWFALSVGMDF